MATGNIVGSLFADLKFKADQASLSKAVSQANTAISSIGKETTKTVKTINTGMNNASKSVKTFSEHVMTARGYVKDFSKVVTGILMAQLFYQGFVQPIKNAITAIKEFHQEIETTTISFKYLLGGSKELASELMNVVKEMAALTPYTFEQMSDMTKMLLRYGFEGKTLKPTLKILMDTASAYGMNSLQLENFTRALGQMMGKGQLVGQEKKQLGELIPIMKIFKEEIGMTGEEFQKTAIDASLAMETMLSWMRKNHKDAAKEMEQTIQGYMSSIHDFALFLVEDMLGPFWDRVKSSLKSLRNWLMDLLDAYETGGMQGLFEKLFPPEMVQTAIIFYNSIQKILQSVWQLITAFGPLLQILIEFGTRMLAYILPPITWLIEKIVQLVKWVITARGPMKLLVVAIGTLAIATVVAGLVGMLSKAIMGLGIAAGVAKLLNWLSIAIRGVYIALSSHPIAAIITAIAGALVYLAMSSEWGQRALARLQARIAGFFGISTAIEGVTQATKEGTDAFGKYNDQIKGLFTDAEEGAGGASDEMKKFLASFDEVYQVPEENGGFGGGLEFPEIPDYSTEIDEATESVNNLGNSIRNIGDLLGKIPPIFILPKIQIPIPQIEWEPAYEYAKQQLANAWERIKEWAKGLKPIEAPNWSFKPLNIPDLGKIFEGLGKSIKEWWGQTGLAKWMDGKGFWDSVGQSISTAWNSTSFAKWFNNIDWKGLWDDIGKALKEAVDWLAWVNNNILEPIFEGLPQAMLLLLSAVVIALAAVVGGPALAQKAQEVFSNWGYTLGQAAVVGASPGGIINGIIDNIGEIATALLTAITTAIQRTIEDIVKKAVEVGSKFVGGIITGIKNKFTELTNAVYENIYKPIKTKVDEIINSAKEWAKTAFSNFITGITAKLTEIEKKMQEVYNTIRNKVKEAWDNAIGWGKNIIAGIISGLNSGITALKDAIKSVIETAISKAKEVLGIQSPSTIFAAMGNNIALGLANGINDGSSIVEKAMNNLLPINSPANIETVKNTVAGSSTGNINNSGFDINELLTALSNRETTSNNSSNIASDYVLIPVDKRQLERELYVIRKQESFRVAGRTV